ncbi:MAG: ComEC/Rec2 family competence protein [Henriciella sp.]|uniref:ComEC/Rec2 family competence protein n=1 Tax=Henriciella sp. TaxID=1968823 RepID=UPI003C7851EA
MDDAASDRVDALRILRGPLYFALGLVIGVACYFSLLFEPTWLAIASVSGTVLIASLALRRYNLPYAARVLLFLLAGAACGLFLGKYQIERASRHLLTETVGPAMVEGWVTSIEPGRNGSRLRLDVHAIGGETTQTLPSHVRLTHSLSLNVAPGRFVRCWAVIRPPPQPALPGDYDFSRQAFVEGLDGVGYVQGRCQGGALSADRGGLDGLTSRLAQARRALALHVEKAAGERAGGLAAALTSGDRSFMRPEDTDALRGSGLAHLLAISGLHLGLISGLIYLFVRRGLALWEWLALRFPVQKIAALAAILGAAVYLVISGSSISTQRAFIMAAVFFGAILFDKSPLSIRSFSIAMIAVIVIHPHSVMSPGFQMSFAATGALIASFEAWTRRRRARGDYGGGFSFTMKSLVLSSFIGAAATAPFALYHFDRLAPFGLAANLVAMPIITFISAPAAGLALLTWPLGLSDLFLAIFGWSLERVLDIAWWGAEAGGNGVGLGDAMPQPVFCVLIVGLIVCCLSQTWRAAITVAVSAGFAATLGIALSPKLLVHASASGDVFIRTDQGHIHSYAYFEGNGLAPLRYSDLEQTGNCRDRACLIDSSIGALSVGRSLPDDAACRTADTPIILSNETTEQMAECIPPSGQAVLTFEPSDVPFTIYDTFFGGLEIKSPECGHRPWAPCLDTS